MTERLVTFVQLRGDATLAAGLTAVALVQIVLLDESASVRLGAAAHERALRRALHRTGALARGRVNIWLPKADCGHGAGARRRRTVRAQTTGVAFCGKYDMLLQGGNRGPAPYADRPFTCV